MASLLLGSPLVCQSYPRSVIQLAVKITYMPDNILVLNTSQPHIAMGVMADNQWMYQFTPEGSSTNGFSNTGHGELMHHLQHALPGGFSNLAGHIAHCIVCIGPGSYTGLRTGLAIARTLGLLMGKEGLGADEHSGEDPTPSLKAVSKATRSPQLTLWPVTQFQLALSPTLTKHDPYTWVLLPALRHTAYAALLDANHRLVTLAPNQPQTVDVRQWQPENTSSTEPIPVWYHPALAAYIPPTVLGPTSQWQCLPDFSGHNSLSRALELWQQQQLSLCPWQDLHPLYIQAPHITPAKAKPQQAPHTTAKLSTI
jgi:hypothetical protein